MAFFSRWGRIIIPVLLFSDFNTWARALPPSHGLHKSISNRESHSPPILYQPDIESTWIKCDPTTAVDGARGLGCTVLGHDTPLHRRSVTLLGRDSHLHHTSVNEPVENDNPAASLYPCHLRNKSGARRLRCRRADRASRSVLDDSTYELLISELLNGLPISVGPNITPSPGFDTANYFVQVYPVDKSYDLRLLATSTPSEPETVSEPLSPRSILPPHLLLKDTEQNTNMHPAVKEDGSSVKKRTDGLLAFELKGVLFCWYHENKYETELELNCGVEVEAEAFIAVSDDEIDDDSDESTEASAQQDFYQDQLVKYLYSLVIPPLVSLYNSEEGSEEAWLQVPKSAAKLLVVRLSELVGNTNFDIATFDWSPVIKGVMHNLREATKQKYGTEKMDSVDLFEMLLTHYLDVYSDNYIFPDEDLEGISSETSNGQVGFFNLGSKEQEHFRRHLVLTKDQESKKDGSSTQIAAADSADPPTGLVVNRWFRCFDASGSKVLCEIPDWYDHDQENVGTLSTKRHKATKRRHSNDKSSAGHEFPAQFSAGPPRLWHNCKFDRQNGKYRMVCPLTPHPEYMGATGEAITGSHTLPLLRRGVITSPLSSILATSTNTETLPFPTLSQTDIGDTPLPTAAPPMAPPVTSTCAPPASQIPGTSPISLPAFGRMGDTLAYIGFFTLLILFAVIMFLVVSNLFLTVQDALDALREWKDRNGWKRNNSSVEEANLDQGLTHPAPAYVSHDNHYHIGDGISAPINTALTEIRRLSIASTGSQPVDEGGDTIKRKKIPIRGVVDEEIGII